MLETSFNSKKIIVIAGPTASGKTSLSVAVAKQLNCSIISADSRQFYKELAIGTAKPTPEEMDGVLHYFIDSHSIKEPISSGVFEKEATKVVEKLFKTHDYIVVVGGSGMFIDALIYGTDKIPHDLEIREKWNQIYLEKGLEYLQNALKSADLDYFKEVDLENPVRLIRALEVIDITQKPYSELRKSTSKTPHFPTSYFVLNHPREILYERINLRVDKMLENGLIEEVKANLSHKNLQPLNTVGYQEVFQFLEGKISKEEAVELIKRNTRRFAKRQLTWFRKNKNAIWLDYQNEVKMVEEVLKQVGK